ncbi:hypothetical protein N7478_010561 [Penicillium angulare]|uniref:uncharacterized protein n=1 Tax=Penicillium angulare TaxID=116970 RepID=UPI0025425E45|nr:uncharacterized protein N7478_010561 [Penicillium angulare]KAJ5267753.1 hypothetical protein N7478_010561 [Penicillium angulare]
METMRRRQLHSCDPCRKGKRGCDAPKVRTDSGFGPCSNCKRWKKECTFNWLASKRSDTEESRKKTKPSAAAPSQSSDTDYFARSHDAELDAILGSANSYAANLGDIFTFTNTQTSFGPSFQPDCMAFEGRSRSEWSDDQSNLFTWSSDIPVNEQINTMTSSSNNSFTDVGPNSAFGDLFSHSLQNDPTLQMDAKDEPVSSLTPAEAAECEESGSNNSLVQQYTSTSRPEAQWSFCFASDKTSKEYVRSTMTRNLIRIYHDSMENALSCWLTEHNCPYGDSPGNILPCKQKEEWAPSWSNRMCIRVCRLDRVSSSVRGRALSAEEDKTAARVLHLAIMAFASQWTQHAQKGTGSSIPEAIDQDERSIREHVWNKARHALEHTTGIPSFRVIFANIIFSLTQRPLNSRHDRSLSELLEADRAPMFLENANRQLYTFRHKLTRIQREAHPLIRGQRRQSVSSRIPDGLGLPQPLDTSGVDPILSDQEYRTTLSLMFWLGIMFDTLSAAMYQRPLVVSDEDSQISSASPTMFDSGNHFEYGGWDIPQKGIPEQQDVWGDFFLGNSESQQSNKAQPRWPCYYDEAASVLSDATPVKVLLYRRVTQLQTLVYRGAPSERLEEVIQKTIQVYRHWNSKYQKFMLDCVANHELLPPRIQSWYVILDGHWHLSIMLLADVIEGIDRGRMGSDSERENREASSFVSTLKMDHAFAVGALARSSLRDREPTMNRHFHDSVNEVAFLVEPWTVVLIHSFAKAGYNSLEFLNAPGKYPSLIGMLCENCGFCIRALEYLGRKSDMATVVARTLSKSLDTKLNPRSENYRSKILTPNSISPDIALFDDQLNGNIDLLVAQ